MFARASPNPRRVGLQLDLRGHHVQWAHGTAALGAPFRCRVERVHELVDLHAAGAEAGVEQFAWLKDLLLLEGPVLAREDFPLVGVDAVARGGRWCAQIYTVPCCTMDRCNGFFQIHVLFTYGLQQSHVLNPLGGTRVHTL